MEASYWWAILELGKAAELNHEALRLAGPYAADSVISCYETQTGVIANAAEEWPVAITMFLSALDRIDPLAHPRLALVAGHNLAKSAIGLGQLDTAMSAILRLHRSYDLLADLKAPLKREHLVAAIAEARGHWREAELRLHAVRDGFMEHQMPHEAAQIDFELAEVAAKTDRWATAAHLAASAARALTAAGSPREAAAASHLLREAALRRRDSGGRR